MPIDEVSEQKYSTAPNSPMPSPEAKLLHISLNATQGTPDEMTFSVLVQINGITAVALIDTGSSCSFMTYDLAVKSNQKLLSTDSMRVTVADGSTMFTSKFVCPKYQIQGEQFTTPFRLLWQNHLN